jgi:hypothetical protein
LIGSHAEELKDSSARTRSLRRSSPRRNSRSEIRRRPRADVSLTLDFNLKCRSTCVKQLYSGCDARVDEAKQRQHKRARPTLDNAQPGKFAPDQHDLPPLLRVPTRQAIRDEQCYPVSTEVGKQSGPGWRGPRGGANQVIGLAKPDDAERGASCVQFYQQHF